jgi:hypothetical protein
MRAKKPTNRISSLLWVYVGHLKRGLDRDAALALTLPLQPAPAGADSTPTADGDQDDSGSGSGGKLHRSPYGSQADLSSDQGAPGAGSRQLLRSVSGPLPLLEQLSMGRHSSSASFGASALFSSLRVASEPDTLLTGGDEGEGEADVVEGVAEALVALSALRSASTSSSADVNGSNTSPTGGATGGLLAQASAPADFSLPPSAAAAAAAATAAAVATAAALPDSSHDEQAAAGGRHTGVKRPRLPPRHIITTAAGAADSPAPPPAQLPPSQLAQLLPLNTGLSATPFSGHLAVAAAPAHLQLLQAAAAAAVAANADHAGPNASLQQLLAGSSSAQYGALLTPANSLADSSGLLNLTASLPLPGGSHPAAAASAAADAAAKSGALPGLDASGTSMLLGAVARALETVPSDPSLHAVSRHGGSCPAVCRVHLQRVVLCPWCCRMRGGMQY